jgi:predicted enzyme related to lactoylglutathione lyase
MKLDRREFFRTGGLIAAAFSHGRAMTTDMSHTISAVAEDVLKIIPSITSSENDFDFLVGTWNVKNRKLKRRLARSKDWVEFDSTLEMRKVLNGIANFERYKTTFDGKPFEGTALRLFNPQTRLWSIYWADTNAGVLDKNPVVGSFEGHLGKFYSRDTFNGKNITVLYQWDIKDPKHPVWSQAFSTDRGKSWEWNWFMTATRPVGAIDCVRFTQIPVTNQTRALKFYKETMGMVVYRDGQFSKDWRWIELSIPGAETRVLFSRRPDESPRSEPNVFLVAADFAQSCESLKAKGVEFVQEPKKEHWGEYALFRDTENNLIQLDSGKE